MNTSSYFDKFMAEHVTAVMLVVFCRCFDFSNST